MNGKIYTYTVIRSSTEKFSEKVPYVVAVIETDKGRLTAFVDNYTDGQTIEIGQTVTFSHNDEKERPIYKF